MAELSKLIASNGLNLYVFYCAESSQSSRDLLQLTLEKVLALELLDDQDVGQAEQFLKAFEAFISVVLASVEVRRRHLKLLYQFLASPKVEAYGFEKKSRVLHHSLRVLKIFYHYIENKLMRPNVYYTFPREVSEFRFSTLKAGFKVKTEESFCFAVWVFLSPANTDRPRNIVALLNQAGEGVRLQFHQGKLQVLAVSTTGPSADKAADGQARLKEASVLSTPMSEGTWSYITMAYENRTCSHG